MERGYARFKKNGSFINEYRTNEEHLQSDTWNPPRTLRQTVWTLIDQKEVARAGVSNRLQMPRLIGTSHIQPTGVDMGWPGRNRARVKEICPRGNNKVIIYFLIYHDKSLLFMLELY